MVALAYQQNKIAGTALTFVAASAGGDTVPVNDRGILLVKNTDVAAHNITVDVPGNTRYGQANPDVTVAVAAGATVAVGPFPSDLANPSDGLVHITYASTTGMTVAALVS